MVEAVTQDGYAGGAGLVLFGEKPAAQRHPHTQHGEKIGVHFPQRGALGIAAGGEIHRNRRIGGQALEGAALLPPVRDVGIRTERVMDVPLVVIDANRYQPVGLGKRQRTKQHGVHGAEDGGIGANAQRQRQYRHRGDAGVLKQQPATVTEVGQNLTHNRQSYTARPAFLS